MTVYCRVTDAKFGKTRVNHAVEQYFLKYVRSLFEKERNHLRVIF
jgi:hypothetical protein